MRIFLTIWIGQLVSLFGSKLSEFAFAFWILEQTYQATGTITQFALTILFIYLPKVIVSPLAGVLVDRWNRRQAMIMSDAVSGIITVVAMGLVFTDSLQVWHIYVAVIISSTFNAFQLPAYTAAIAQLVPKEKLSRANGMVQASSAIAKIAAPFVAGLLMELIRLEGILIVDFLTFIFALITLASVPFPRFKPKTIAKKKIIGEIGKEMISGWSYIAVRPGLLWLLSFIAISYFTSGMLEVVLWPLLYQPGSTEQLGLVLSIGGCGMLVGSLLMSVWKGPSNRVTTILSFVFFQGIIVFLGGLRVSIFVLAIGIFGYLFSLPIIVSCNQAIWQSKVPLNLQGRIFALQQAVERSLAICAYLIAGPLVDNILNPLMARDGLLAQSIGKIIGVGFGQGIALLLILLGIVNIIATVIASREPRLRYLEVELPDINQSNLDFNSV
jgi:DHA3 family macrolide efflux protein-like MFS transporter